MTKLSVIRLYKTENVPEHLLEETKMLIGKMFESLDVSTKGHGVNIILSAFNRIHASMIVNFVTEKGLFHAAKTELVGLMKNIEHISGQNFNLFEDE